MNKLLPVLALALLAFPLHAQQNKSFQITSIKPDLVTTPEYNISYGPKNKKVSKNKEFLEIEVAFDWQPAGKIPNDAKYLDELTVNYFVLLNNKSKQRPTPTLLVGSVTHTAIPIEKDLKSVMYISPRTLERFFEGTVPATANAIVSNVAVTITQQGGVVAEKSFKEDRKNWWTTGSQTTGYLLNKNETPFAPLVWDYYEAIKGRPAGF